MTAVTGNNTIVIQETAHAALGGWESFYVIVGSSAAALTGLQFVVITLVSEVRHRASDRELSAFATPTIVHFCAALFVSAAVSAPWPTLFGPAMSIGTCGVIGIAYAAIVVWRARRQSGYHLVAEDWVWHVVLPFVAYAAELAAAVLLEAHTVVPMFVIAAATLLLVFIGIHNAWDTTTFVATQSTDEAPAASTDAAG